MKLSIDIETYSGTDLSTAGLYKYAADCEVLMFCYAVDDGPVQTIDCMKQELPTFIMKSLVDPEILKTAFNAAFERACLSAYYRIDLPAEQWECTMIRAAMLGLPLSLEEAAKALGTRNQKDTTGKALIRFFSIPCKPTKANGMRVRNYPSDAPDKWEAFLHYCALDVEAERDISNNLSFYKISEQEHNLWCLDQRINERGIMVDIPFAEMAIKLDEGFRERLIAEAQELTGLSNPNSPAQLKKWLEEVVPGLSVPSLNKDNFSTINAQLTPGSPATRMMQIRQELAKTSVKKYTAMVNAAGDDHRVRGLLQFYGANRTGRWGGRLVQVQNLPRGNFKDVATPRALVMDGDPEILEMLCGAIPDTLSSLIRSAFIPAPGSRFIVSDFSAIEARVISWLSGQKWRLEVFQTHGKIYEASASQMFKVPLNEIGKDSPLRQKGKVSELALGYQGGPNALIQMGALEMGVVDLSEFTDEKLRIRFNGLMSEYAINLKQGISVIKTKDPKSTRYMFDPTGDTFEDYKKGSIENEQISQLQDLVDDWRDANPRIVQFWRNVDVAAKDAIFTGEKTPILGGDGKYCGMTFHMEKKWLFLTLPSGRKLSYAGAHTTKNEDGRWGTKIRYWGMNQTTKQWQLIDTYGGKLVENIVQALSRDLLAEALVRLDKEGYDIVMHVHDEAVIEMPIGTGDLEDVNEIMAMNPDWAKGLPLAAEGFETYFYKK